MLTLMSGATDAWSLTRSVSGVSGAVTLYDGPCLANLVNAPPQPIPFPDAGIGSNQPLSQTTAYVYTFTTSNGSVSTPPIVPAVQLTLLPDVIVNLVMKSLQAGLQALRVPAGFQNKPTIQHAMPINKTPPLPIISINQDLMQQDQSEIGAGVNPDQWNNQYSVPATVHRRISVFIATTSVEERAFYRDAVISIWRTMLGPLLHPLGQDLSQRFQATDNQVTKPDDSPGFYYSEIGLEFTGVFLAHVVTDYPVIEGFTTDFSFDWTSESG